VRTENARSHVRKMGRGESNRKNARPLDGPAGGHAGIPFELFAASADGVFWCDPCRPNPYSWLTTSVVCGDTLEFRIEVLEDTGDPVDVLDFGPVPPAAYRFILVDSGDALEGVITLRFVYGGADIWDGRIKRDSQE
jgi:hypothetical protein